MVLLISIKEVAQVLPHVHHQHRLRGWTLSTETGDSLLLAGEEVQHQCSDWRVACPWMGRLQAWGGRLSASSATCSVSPNPERVHAE